MYKEIKAYLFAKAQPSTTVGTNRIMEDLTSQIYLTNAKECEKLLEAPLVVELSSV